MSNRNLAPLGTAKLRKGYETGEVHGKVKRGLDGKMPILSRRGRVVKPIGRISIVESTNNSAVKSGDVRQVGKAKGRNGIGEGQSQWLFTFNEVQVGYLFMKNQARLIQTGKSKAECGAFANFWTSRATSQSVIMERGRGGDTEPCQQQGGMRISGDITGWAQQRGAM